MRKFILAIATLSVTTSIALAADTEGLIKKIDQDNWTITLDDGQTYKLPAEVDMSALSDGMDVVIAYRDAGNGVKQITDMVLPDSDDDSDSN